jgi:predicted aspartyl protease
VSEETEGEDTDAETVARGIDPAAAVLALLVTLTALAFAAAITAAQAQLPPTPLPTGLPSTPQSTGLPSTPQSTGLPPTPQPTESPPTPLPTGLPPTPQPTGLPSTPQLTGLPQCQLTRLTTVKIDTLPDGRIKIPVMVDDHPLSFMLDTGGISTTIKGEQAKQLGLEVRQTSRKLLGVAGTMLDFFVIGDNFSVGGLRIKGWPLYIESRPLAHADGTLAPDILQSYDLDIDFSNGSLSLISQGHCPGQLADWTTTTRSIVIPIDLARNGHIRFPVQIDGKSIMATLDTGSAISLISMKAAAQLGIDANTPELKLMRDSGQYQIYAYPFHSLALGRVSVKNPHIAIASDNFANGLGSDLLLGIDAVRQMHLYIAYGDKRLYIEVAQAN